MSDLIKEQPAPKESAGPDMWLLVLDDMAARRRVGLERDGK